VMTRTSSSAGGPDRAASLTNRPGPGIEPSAPHGVAALTFTVALVGGDGSGKTSVARQLERSPTLRCKYLYMGQSLLSSNAPLPTSRLARFLKLREARQSAAGAQEGGADERAAGDPHYQKKKRGWARMAASFLNRLAEAWWRQLLSALYRARGYILIYDRHFLFESAPPEGRAGSKRGHPIERLEHWVLSRSYPPPDLVVFLDAPSEVLYRRKGETSPKRLEKRKTAILRQGAHTANFAIVDASRPLDEVVASVRKLLDEFRRPTEPKGQP
jgi:thymidylate kinase